MRMIQNRLLEHLLTLWQLLIGMAKYQAAKNMFTWNSMIKPLVFEASTSTHILLFLHTKLIE